MKREGLYCFAIGALVIAIAVMDARQRRLLREYCVRPAKIMGSEPGITGPPGREPPTGSG